MIPTNESKPFDNMTGESIQANGDAKVRPGEVNEAELSVYELFCQIVDPEQARHLGRYLREFSRYDENSQPFLYGLLNVSQFKVCAKLPEAVAQRITPKLDEFQDTAQKLLDALNKGGTSQVKQAKVVLPRLTTPSANWWDWPLNQRYSGKLARGLQYILDRFEGIFAYRTRWVVIGSASMAVSVYLFLGYTARQQMQQIKTQEHTRAQQWDDQEVARFAAWQQMEASKTEELRTQNFAEAKRWASDQVNEQLQSLEPACYRLAQQFEQSSRRVKLEDGTLAWEVRITEASGYLSYKLDYERFPICDISLFLRDEPNRMALSATSPAQEPSSDRTKLSRKPR